MSTIIVGFSKPKSKLAIGSYLIRLFEGADFSHAFVYWYSQNIDRTLIYQASHGMVHFLSMEKFLESTEIISTYEITLEQSKRLLVIQNCVDLAGTKYGYWQLLGMGIERITRLRNPFRDGASSYVCSELVAELLRHVDGFDTSLDLELVGPKQLELAVQSLPGVKKLI